ncbi:MAG TPA: hypothetical protein VEO56_11170 [Bacteroidota bacterium]|nr:hypothetical protein [Bacteroidota bacterium]
MLAYLAFFLLVSYVSVKNDAENHYHFVYVLAGAFAYAGHIVGIGLYAIKFQNEGIRRLWKWLFPFQVTFYLVSFVVDSLLGMHADHSIMGIILDMFIFIVGTVLFFPAFLASYSLAYRGEKRIDEKAHLDPTQ